MPRIWIQSNFPLPSLRFCPSQQWHRKIRPLFGWLFPSSICHPQRTAKTASIRVPSCICLFHFTRHLAKCFLSSRRTGFSCLPMLPKSTEEFCTPVLQSLALGAGAKTTCLEPHGCHATKSLPQTPIKRQHNHCDIPTRPTLCPPVYQGTLVEIRLATFLFDCEQGCRCQRKYGLGARPEQFSGIITENASRGSRVSECRMPLDQ